MIDTKDDLIRRAKNMLRGQNATPADLLQLAKALKGRQAFDFARRLLLKARALGTDDQTLRVMIDQQCALCTYKDPDLAMSCKLDLALQILSNVLQEADALVALGAEEWQRRTAAEIKEKQETFGIAGAVFKRKWQASGQLRDLRRALICYEKGYGFGPQTDQGSTGINAAFVLDVLAAQELNEGERRPADVEAAAQRRARARQIREVIIATFAAAPSGGRAASQGSKSATAPPPPDWWTLVTVAEAYFGLGQYAEARKWLLQAKALEGVPRGTADQIQPWEYETTTRQLADLARLGDGADRKAKDFEDSAAWAVLRDFVGAEWEAGVRTAFAGRVGLALSGGGFRASLFHIGVLARLAELDVLRHVEVLSCVSGGSIIGAHYYLEVRKLLESRADNEITRDDYVGIVQRVERDFLEAVQKNPRMRALGSWRSNLRMLGRHYSRTVRIGEVLEEDLYARVAGDVPGVQDAGSVPLSGLYIRPAGEGPEFTPKYDNWRRSNKIPILILNATALNTGHNWQFTASWMGESPAGIDTDVDGNERLRRLYYDEAPEAYQTVRLGLAVAASACVPGLFTPVALPGLYPERIVRLVDGGVHDNQGIAGLLEQDCTVLMVSDASGQMTTQTAPGNMALGALVRSNNILMARVREEEHKELQARQRGALLRGFMFLHLKRDLAVESVDWVECDDPKEDTAAGVPARAVHLTSYGVRADVQELLAGIRTDLDVFCEAEAFALMTSGYRMAEREMSRCLPGLGASDERGPAWRFLAVEPLLTEPAGSARFMRVLALGASRFLKGLRCSSSGPFWLGAVVVAVMVGLVAAFDSTLRAVGAEGSLAWRLLRLSVATVAATSTVVVGAVAAVFSGAVYRLNRLFDRCFLRCGSLAQVRAAQPLQVLSDRGSRTMGVKVAHPPELWVALQQLGVSVGRPVLVAAGGPDELADELAEAVARLFEQTLLPLGRDVGAVVVDSGADIGIARAVGRARRRGSVRTDLVGVPAIGTVRFPGNTRARSDAVPLEACHTHFILAPGSEWTQQCAWMAEVASVIAGAQPSITLVVGGAETALQDAVESVRRGRSIVAVRATGGLADRLAGGDSGAGAAAANAAAIAEIVASGRVHPVDLDTDAATLRTLIHRLWLPEHAAAGENAAQAVVSPAPVASNGQPPAAEPASKGRGEDSLRSGGRDAPGPDSTG
jgi:predicted acylesterase/phospholipase RssA/tetratricopeptide (TPR) repeat protein